MEEELQKLPVDVLRIIRRYRDSYEHYKKFKPLKWRIDSSNWLIYAYRYHDRDYRIGLASKIYQNNSPYENLLKMSPCQICGYDIYKGGNKGYTCRCKNGKNFLTKNILYL